MLILPVISEHLTFVNSEHFFFGPKLQIYLRLMNTPTKEKRESDHSLCILDVHKVKQDCYLQKLLNTPITCCVLSHVITIKIVRLIT